MTWESTLEQVRNRLPAKLRTGPVCLFSFTIAGIQEFLAASRTTRDVWNGSYMLSWLSFKATESLCRKIDSDLSQSFASVIFPDMASQPLATRLLPTAPGPNANELAIASFPNSILAVVPGGISAANNVGRAVSEDLSTRWEEICKAALGVVSRTSGMSHSYARRQWNYQLRFDRVFEWYWSAVELPADENDFTNALEGFGINPYDNGFYGALAQWSGRVLGSRKMLRDFEQIGEEGYRCSLCGARAALANYGSEPRNRMHQITRGLRSTVVSYQGLTDFWNDLRTEAPLQHRIRPSERLCAVCLTRRLAPRFYFVDTAKLEIQPDFPSTSTLATTDFAADSFLKLRNDAGARNAVETYVVAVSKLRSDLATTKRFKIQLPIQTTPLPWCVTKNLDDSDPWQKLFSTDGDFLYSDTWDADSLCRELGNESEEAREAVRNLLPNPRPPDALRAELKKALKNADPSASLVAPANYFAIICCDGDKMGDWIIGTHRSLSDAIGYGHFGIDFQQKLSAALAAFAKAAKLEIEQKYFGKVVYAGGDDFLAFVPVRHALPTTVRLRDTFQEIVTASPLSMPPGKMTLSIASVAARHNDPLSGAIERVQSLLKDAKKKYGRPAFAWMRTTGAGTITGASLHLDIVNKLEEIQKAFASRLLSPRIIYNLAEFHEALTGWTVDTGLDEARRSIIRHEYRRHVQTATAFEPQRKKLEPAFLNLYDDILAWSREDDVKKEAHDPFSVLIDLLDFTHFMLRGTKQ